MEFYARLSIGKLKQKRVSIPNGMEFYFAGRLTLHFIGVSIPNGMEFYQAR